MEEEILIKVEGLSKKFCKSFKKSLRYGFLDILRAFLGIKKKKGLRKSEFWAIKDVNFEIRRGECVGLIGHNGAGKSTLLKLLNGLIKPDQGDIWIKGKIGALIELGAGFNPILTARENVFNYGAVLGFSQKEILSKYKSIVEFAELKGFMDIPVANYSSGMKVRLGFSVAIQMQPDILIVDEVLAVGDIKFRTKCFRKIQELLKNTAVILVSHSMPQISKMSKSLLVMDKGKIRYHGEEIARGINIFLENQKTEVSSISETNDIKVKEIYIDISSNISIQFDLEFNTDELSTFYATVDISNQEMRQVIQIDSRENFDKFKITEGKYNLNLEFPNVLSNGLYYVNLSLRKNPEFISAYRFQNLTEFQIMSDDKFNHGNVQLKGNWSLDNLR